MIVVPETLTCNELVALAWGSDHEAREVAKRACQSALARDRAGVALALQQLCDLANSRDRGADR